MICPFTIEPLEARIAPAVMIVNPLFDLTPAIGKTGASIDLSKMVDVSASYRTRIEFTTNYTLPGATSPAKIVIELFDDKAPLTVQNFLGYFDGKTGTTYDGTFFHRIFDFGNSSEDGVDIIQAGGFNIASPTVHMATDPTVHNEFNPDDPEVQNIRGTIAMAKTSISPDTGSSEWFINLTNNSSILGGDNNGGFTVFGRIVSGLEVADAIGKSKTLDLSSANSAFTDIPVQNYTAGSPTLDQLIQITDAKIIPPTTGNDGGGLTYEVQVANPASGALVKGTIDQATKQLKLTYSKTLNGQAQVTVNVKDSTNAIVATDTFSVNLVPNLIASFSADTLPQTFVPGDKGTVKVQLTNNLAALAKGAVNIKLFLSKTTGSEPFVIGEDSIEITAKGTANVSVASGKSVSVPVSYLIPSDASPGTAYYLLAQVTQPDGSTLVEKFSDDNTGISFASHTFSLSFGAVGGRAKVPLTISHDGEDLTFTLTGKGTGVVTVDGDFLDVSLTGTNASSSFSIKTAHGVIGDLGDVSINDTIGSIKLGNIQLHGNFAASSGAKSIIFGDLGDNTAGVAGLDKDFTIGSPAPDSTQKVSLKFGKVRDYSLSSALTISSLTAVDWLNDETNTQPDTIVTAAGLTALKITGDFEANLTSASATKISSITVGGTLHDGAINSFGDIATLKFGSVSGSTIKTTGNLTTLASGPLLDSTVEVTGNLTTLTAGTLVGSTIKTGGNISTVTVASIGGSSILAGVTEKPDAAEDFAIARTIGTLKVNGTFANSTVAAANLNSVTIDSADGNAGEEIGGIYAIAIKSYLRKEKGGPRQTNLRDLDVGDELPTIADEVLPRYQVALF